MKEWKAINEFKRYIRLTNILQFAPEFQQHLRRVKIYSIWYKDIKKEKHRKNLLTVECLYFLLGKRRQ